MPSHYTTDWDYATRMYRRRQRFFRAAHYADYVCVATMVVGLGIGVVNILV